MLRDEFISEDDLQTFEGWLAYQAINPPMSAPEELEKWRSVFEEARARIAASPKVGLMKLQPVPGEHKYAVAIEDASNLWLTLWVRRSQKGEFFVMLPRGNRDWDPHTSYHRDGTLHFKSYGDTVLERKNQPLTGTFRGSEDLGSFAGHGPKGVGAVCDPAAFSGVVKVPLGVLGPRQGVIKLDLIEPGHEPMKFPGKTVLEEVFHDAVPWLVIRVATASHSNQHDTAPLDTIHGLAASRQVEDNQVSNGLRGCGERGDTMDVIHLHGHNPKLRGESDPRENVCGSGFPTFFIGKDIIRLCQACRVKSGLIW